VAAQASIEGQESRSYCGSGRGRGRARQAWTGREFSGRTQLVALPAQRHSIAGWKKTVKERQLAHPPARGGGREGEGTKSGRLEYNGESW
jgi:hypothetical protein